MIERLTGVVSLLDMLEFAARDFLDLSYNVGMMLGALNRLNQRPNELGREISQSISALPDECKRLDLPVTGQFLGDFLVEAFSGMGDKEKAEAFRHLQTTGEFRLMNVNLSAERMVQHVETIYRSFRAELSSLQLRVVPREKNGYINEKWLTETLLFTKYPDTVDEMKRAGRCYAYGENTACVFHLMRVAEFYFTKVAQSLQDTFDPKNWSEISRLIGKKMEQKYPEKSAEWRAQEPFYAEVLCDLQAFGRAHRNPALHDLERKYDEGEAKRLLDIVESFATHVAKQL